MSGGRRRDRQAVRLLSIFLLLLQGARPTVQGLAARFKTRRETIYRDLRTLTEVGVPVEGDESGRLSRPRLSAEYRLRFAPVPLTKHEIAALAWAVAASRPRQPFRAALSTALPKLQTFTPARDGRLAAEVEGTVGGWERGVKNYEALGPRLLRLLDASVNLRRCMVEYQSPGRPHSRRFPYDPYRILSVHGGLYCIGKVPAYRKFVTLAVERIRELTVTDEAFSVDAGFDLQRYEAEAFGVTWEKPMAVTLRFSADQAPHVREREWHPTQRIRELKDGRVQFTFRAGGTLEITRWILGWGDRVEVIRPRSLRRDVARIVTRTIAAYRSLRPMSPRDGKRGSIAETVNGW